MQTSVARSSRQRQVGCQLRLRCSSIPAKLVEWRIKRAVNLVVVGQEGLDSQSEFRITRTFGIQQGGAGHWFPEL